MLTRTRFMKNKSEDGGLFRSLGLFGLIVSDTLICSGIGIGLGYYLWKSLGAPWWVLVLTSVAGLVLAFYRLYKYAERDPE